LSWEGKVFDFEGDGDVFGFGGTGEADFDGGGEIGGAATAAGAAVEGVAPDEVVLAVDEFHHDGLLANHLAVGALRPDDGIVGVDLEFDAAVFDVVFELADGDGAVADLDGLVKLFAGPGDFDAFFGDLNGDEHFAAGEDDFVAEAMSRIGHGERDGLGKEAGALGVVVEDLRVVVGGGSEVVAGVVDGFGEGGLGHGEDFDAGIAGECETEGELFGPEFAAGGVLEIGGARDADFAGEEDEGAGSGDGVCETGLLLLDVKAVVGLDAEGMLAAESGKDFPEGFVICGEGEAAGGVAVPAVDGDAGGFAESVGDFTEAGVFDVDGDGGRGDGELLIHFFEACGEAIFDFVVAGGFGEFFEDGLFVEGDLFEFVLSGFADFGVFIVEAGGEIVPIGGVVGLGGWGFIGVRGDESDEQGGCQYAGCYCLFHESILDKSVAPRGAGIRGWASPLIRKGW